MVTYESVIGLEVHIQLNTRTKAFCGDLNKFSADPNRHISAISLALPGTLPYMNISHIRKAIKLGLALDCTINPENYFDRKNYFYPDLPKGYQITQQNAPICLGGHVELSDCHIRIHHIHMEEDAGKSIHNLSDVDTLLDYNRAGVPLLELVTEPDFRRAEQVHEFINYLRQLVRYLDISDAIMQEGSLRCDVNLSIRPKGVGTYGTRCEIKNLNSANYARKAIELEFERQKKIVEHGRQVEQQTLDFDFDTGRITPLRSKEEAHDYRYFPEPDMPTIIIDDQLIDEIRSEIDFLPKEMIAELQGQFGLSDYDAAQLAEIKEVGLHFISLAAANRADNKLLASFYINKLLPLRRTETDVLNECPLSEEQIFGLLELIQSKKISASAAYQNLLPLLLTSDDNPQDLAKEKNLLQDTDQGDIDRFINDVLDSNPDKVKAYLSGKRGLLGFFMGEVMKKSQGKASPQVAKALLEQQLSKRS